MSLCSTLKHQKVSRQSTTIPKKNKEFRRLPPLISLLFYRAAPSSQQSYQQRNLYAKLRTRCSRQEHEI